MTIAPTYCWEVPPTGHAAAFAGQFAALVPHLETVRCSLRAPGVGDFQAYADIMMSDRATFMGGPLDRRDSWLDFVQLVSNWILFGHGLWTIEVRDTRAIAGFVLVSMEHGNHEPELGYFLTADHEGMGIASEAATAARDWALNTLKMPALVSYIDPENAASVRVTEKLGAKKDAAAEAFYEHKMIVMRHAGALQ